MTVRSIRPPELSSLTDPERQLALNYARTADRAALTLLWQLDERLATIVAAAREPMIGAMRLVWWRDALAGLDRPELTVPAEPLLAEVASILVPRGLAGSALAQLEDGWSALLDDDLGEEAIISHAEGRGGPLFAMSAVLLGAVPHDVGDAGEGWALADLGHRLSDANARRIARAEAARRLATVDIGRWPAALKPLGLLVVLARQDAAMPAERLRRQGSPKRLLRALAYRLIGR